MPQWNWPPGPRLTADGVWAGLTLGLLALVGWCGANVPYMDEWPTVDALAGRRPLGPWLVEWHNEHLLPAPRLAYWGLYQLARDLRAGMIASVLMWAALARVLMAAARAARGGPGYADAAFPLLLLHAGQFENVLMSYQVCFALSALLAGLMVAAAAGGPPTAGRVAVVAACGGVLPACGGHGLVFALAGWAWLAVVGAAGLSRRGGVGRGAGLLAAVGLTIGLAVGSAYGWWPNRPDPGPKPPITPVQWVSGWFGFGAAGFGPVGERLWPATATLPGAIGAAAAVAAWRARRERTGPRWAAYLGLVAGLVAVAGLAAAVAWGRGRHGIGAVFFPRYVGLSALGPAFAVLFWTHFPGGRIGAFGPPAVATIAALALPFNTLSGWRSGVTMADIQTGVRDDLGAGVPVPVVARKYHFLTYPDPPALADFLTRAGAAGVVPGAPLAEPPVRSAPLPPPTARGPVRPLDGGGWASTGPGGELVFDVEPPVFARAVVVRGTYRYPGTWPPARATVTVRRPDGSEAVAVVRVYRYPTAAGGDPALIAWVEGPVREVRVSPDAHPWGFRVTGAELLVPAGH